MSKNHRREYTKEMRLKALKCLRDNNMNAYQTSQQTGINRATIAAWANSDWGQTELARLAVVDQGMMITSGLQAIVEAKVDHLQSEFKFFRELEDLMKLLIDKYNDLIPNEKKLENINNAFKNIAEVYLKAINNNINNNTGDNNKDDDKKKMILNLIDKQLVVNNPGGSNLDELRKMFPKQPVA